MTESLRRTGSDASVTVVIPNYNGAHLLGECLCSLFEQTHPAERIVVVDDASTDCSVSLIRSHFPEVNVIELQNNQGFCRAANRGLEAAGSTYIALLNNDAVADKEWLNALTRAMEAVPEAGSCAAKMIFSEEKRRINSAGLFMRVDGVARDIGYGHPDGGEFDQYGSVFGASGGAAMYRRSMLEDVGFFDEDFVAYSEDVDLSFRAQLRGWECLFVPSAVVYHHGGVSYQANSPKRTFCSSRNMLTVVLKDFPTTLLLRHWHQILLAQVYQVFYFTMRGQARDVILGKLAALKALPSTYRKRKAIQAGRRVTDLQIETILSKWRWRPSRSR